MLLSSGYCVFSHPEICSGDQSNTSLPATISRNLRFPARRHRFARNADFQACLSATRFHHPLKVVRSLVCAPYFAADSNFIQHLHQALMGFGMLLRLAEDRHFPLKLRWIDLFEAR